MCATARCPGSGGAGSQTPRSTSCRSGLFPRRDYDRELRGLLGAAAPEGRGDGRRAKTGPLNFLGVLEVGPDLKAVEFRPDEYLEEFAVHFAKLAGADLSGYHDIAVAIFR